MDVLTPKQYQTVARTALAAITHASAHDAQTEVLNERIEIPVVM
jgi:hypothetical protein